MKTILIILFASITLNLNAQKISRLYGCNASIIYKSENNFKDAYLQYYSVGLLPGLESKSMKANPSRYEQVCTPVQQILIPHNFRFGKLENFEKRLDSLNKYLLIKRGKIIQIDIVSGMLFKIETIAAIKNN